MDLGYQKRRNFIYKDRNTGFICENCGENNPPAVGTVRNHCWKCLYSKHVDLEVPGDRASLCGGLMQPVGLDYKGKKGYQLKQKCLLCEKEQLNILAEDDKQDNLNLFLNLRI